MPQFDFTHVFWPQFAWLAVSFAILYFGVVRLTLPRLSKVMDLREGTVSGDLAAARAAKDTADEIDARYHASLEASRVAARAAIVEAKGAATRAGEVRLAAAGARVDARITEAEARIAKAVTGAQASLSEAAAESAQAIVAKLTGTEPSLDAARAGVAAQMGA